MLVGNLNYVIAAFHILELKYKLLLMHVSLLHNISRFCKWCFVMKNSLHLHTEGTSQHK